MEEGEFEFEQECEIACDGSDDCGCAAALCRYGEPLHNHHDGCPACWSEYEPTQLPYDQRKPKQLTM